MSIHWPCYYTVHVYVLIHFCDSMWSFDGKLICAGFFIVCLYMYCLWRSSYQEGRDGILLTSLTLQRSSYQEWRDGILLTSLTPLHYLACPKPGSGFLTSYGMDFLCWVILVKMRCDCSFCWYWWNWLPSLFNLSFHNELLYTITFRHKIK